MKTACEQTAQHKEDVFTSEDIKFHVGIICFSGYIAKKITMNIPENLKYTKDHEWVLIDGDTATIGITDFAQGELGDIVYVDINTVGQSVAANEIFGTVEAVKTVSDLFLPVSGTIEEFNSKLEANPELVNSDPYGDGWMVKVKMDGDVDESSLLSADDYKNLVS